MRSLTAAGHDGTRSARLIGGLAVVLWATPASAAGVTEHHLEALRMAEHSRGNLPDLGVQWTVSASSEEGDEGRSMVLRVVNQGGQVFAEVLAPEGSRGVKYIVESGRMWYYRPGLSRPISVSKRRRVTGNAAVGDIASISFLLDYSAAEVSEELLGERPCWVFELRPNSNRAAYARVRYWVSQSDRLGLRADFYSLSGKKLRTAAWDYESRLTIAGEARPFVSRMTVEEAAGRTKLTMLTYDDPQTQDFPDTLFDPSELAPQFEVEKPER